MQCGHLVRGAEDDQRREGRDHGMKATEEHGTRGH